MSLVLLFNYLLLNMFRMLVFPSSGACDLLWIYFMCCTGDHWGDLGVDGWTILGWISRSLDVGMWTGLDWPRI